MLASHPSYEQSAAAEASEKASLLSSMVTNEASQFCRYLSCSVSPLELAYHREQGMLVRQSVPVTPWESSHAECTISERWCKGR